MRSRVRALAPLLLLVAVVPAAASCATDDGRTLDPPEGDLFVPLDGSTTVAPADDGIPVQEVGLDGFRADSPAFAPGTEIPQLYTAAGESVSPPVRWGTLPPGALELGIVLEDTSDGEPLWLVGGLDPLLEGVRAGELPPNAVNFLAGFPAYVYVGPAASPGETRTFRFTVHAFAAPLGLDPLTPAADVVAAMDAASFTRATFTGTVTGR
jgi:phosphatidylethanolamine-binding protein (PEBP) family uncharacterized protein